MNLFPNKENVFTLFIVALFPLLAFSQTKMPTSVLGNGAGSMSSNQFLVKSTLAQPLIGITKSSNYHGEIGFWYQKSAILVDVEWVARPDNLKDFQLGQNYPNPANSFTHIQFSIPYPAEIKLVLVNGSGRVETCLVQGKYLAGTYQAIFDTATLNSGVYFYQLIADNEIKQYRKLIVAH